MSSSSLRPCRLPFQSTRMGFSTAQRNLAKILTLIATIPPPPSPTDSVLGNPARPHANDVSPAPFEVSVNLDLRLGPSVEMSGGSEAVKSTAVKEEEEGIPTAHSGVVNCFNQSLSCEASTVNKISKKALSAAESNLEADTSSEGECSPEAAPIEHGTREISEITNGSCKPEDEINEETERDGGYLDLLLEAARQVSGECGNDGEDESYGKAPSGSGSRKRRRTTSSPEPLRSNPKKKSSPESASAAAAAALNVYDEREPIVRSRRGRNQVLPSRFRDSILEPWRKLPTVCRR